MSAAARLYSDEMPPVGDTNAALSFLRRWEPNGPWLLTAILPDGATETQTFRADQESATFAWIEMHQGKRNLYFSVNRPHGHLTSKASKSDIAALLALHVDVDPRKGNDLKAEQERSIRVLREYDPPPTVIIFSGGGAQGFWKFSEPVVIDGDPKHYEAFNERIMEALDADHCQDICRIMRLPGTINLPTKTKREKGRKPALACIVEAHWDRLYSLDDFKSAPSETSCAGLSDDNLDELDIDALPISKRMKNLVRGIDDPKHPYKSRSEAVFAVVAAMVAGGCSDDQMAAIFLDAKHAISAHVREQSKPEQYLARQIKKLRSASVDSKRASDNSGAPVLNPRAPLSIAHIFSEQRGERVLRHHAASFYEWQGTHYAELDDGDIEAALYSFLEEAKREYKNGIGPFHPERSDVEKVRHALQSHVHVRSTITPPAWLDGNDTNAPLLACANGLLRFSDGVLLPHSKDFFNVSAVGFDYEPSAPEPAEWLSFLSSVWPNDQQSIQTLQEVFGYLISGEQKHQKMFLLVGPPRSGKGTIGRVLNALMGSGGCVGLTLASLAKNFGLAPLINKSLAIVPDARLRGGSHEIVERLLAISGGDRLTIDRKYKNAWTGRLPARFVFLTNEVPVLADNSGAIASRFIILEFRVSFLGREDLALEGRLLRELPAILNWAVAGWRRLEERGHFVNASGASARLLGELASPIKAFLEDRCEIGAAFSVAKKELFAAWVHWCEDNGREHPGNEATFGRDLHAAAPDITAERVQEGGTREQFYRGVRLRRPQSPAEQGGHPRGF